MTKKYCQNKKNILLKNIEQRKYSIALENYQEWEKEFSTSKMNRLNKSVSKKINKLLLDSGDRYIDDQISKEYYLGLIRYIHQNPVKAGICRKPKDYKHSSYNEFIEKCNLVDCELVFEMISKEQFVVFNNEKNSDSCLDIEDKPLIKFTDEEAQRIIEKIPRRY